MQHTDITGKREAVTNCSKFCQQTGSFQKQLTGCVVWTKVWPAFQRRRASELRFQVGQLDGKQTLHGAGQSFTKGHELYHVINGVANQATPRTTTTTKRTALVVRRCSFHLQIFVVEWLRSDSRSGHKRNTKSYPSKLNRTNTAIAWKTHEPCFS